MFIHLIMTKESYSNQRLFKLSVANHFFLSTLQFILLIININLTEKLAAPGPGSSGQAVGTIEQFPRIKTEPDSRQGLYI